MDFIKWAFLGELDSLKKRVAVLENENGLMTKKIENLLNYSMNQESTPQITCCKCKGEIK